MINTEYINSDISGLENYLNVFSTLDEDNLQTHLEMLLEDSCALHIMCIEDRDNHLNRQLGSILGELIANSHEGSDQIYTQPDAKALYDRACNTIQNAIDTLYLIKSVVAQNTR